MAVIRALTGFDNLNVLTQLLTPVVVPPPRSENLFIADYAGTQLHFFGRFQYPKGAWMGAIDTISAFDAGGVMLWNIRGLNFSPRFLDGSWTFDAAMDNALRFADTFFGSAGDDVFSGRGGGDVLHGGPGDDRLYGDDGDDVLHGESGDDRLWGGAGADRLHGGDGGDRLWGGADADRLHGGRGDDWLYGGGGDDRIWGDAGRDRLFGGDGDDALHGGAGNDVLRGGAGNDDLRGGAGHDALFGGRGADILDGGGGSDLIVGGKGDDVLRGGAGRDLFRFDKGDGRDVILDFAPGRDLIELRAVPGFGALRLSDDDGAAVIAYGGQGDRIRLEAVAAADLSAADFLFT